MKSKRINGHGYEEWKLPSGKLHREDGPAYEGIDGLKSWWINGKRHREDGPAIDNGDDYKWWYLNNVEYTEQEYKRKTRSRKLSKLLK